MPEREPKLFDPADMPRYPAFFDVLGAELEGPRTTMDAIVVPSARPALELSAAAEIARASDTPLIVLSSQQSKASEAAEVLSGSGVSAWRAIDIPDDYDHLMFRFTTEVPTRGEAPSSDLSLKRNIGLILGRTVGDRLLFLDDDMRLSTQAMQAGSRLLSEYVAAGYKTQAHHFADKSVVYHALDALRRFHMSWALRGNTVQAGYISGNCLAVNPQQARSHFPDIYNEDWLFLYDPVLSHQVALDKDHSPSQALYDPFQSPERAASEEFGDVIVEGLYTSIQRGVVAEFDDPATWQPILAERHERILKILGAVDTKLDPYNFTYMVAAHLDVDEQLPRKEEIRSSLEAALRVNETITPAMCVDFYKAWRQDRTTWGKRLDDLPRFTSFDTTLDWLDLSEQTLSS